MSGKRGRSGGKRPGAGRPRKLRACAPAADVQFADAEGYLVAVVQGTVEADPARIQAAKTLIAYQRKRERGPLKGPTPRALDQRDAQAAERQLLDDWARRAAAVRARLGRA